LRDQCYSLIVDEDEYEDYCEGATQFPKYKVSVK
jgi:hypothetical protein